MIKYKLICKKCNLQFDSWFATSLEYEKLKKKRLLNCHECGSVDIEKTLMTPRLSNKSRDKNYHLNTLKYKKINQKLKEYKKFIKNNFDYVGENFAYEARSIHYNNKKKNKGIYGTASNKEIKELNEEGIKTEMVPWLEDKNN
tara:strand:- start:321 stop:749 length:429 start_codon:yes stop_codon:yes gene_type:complete